MKRPVQRKLHAGLPGRLSLLVGALLLAGIRPAAAQMSMLGPSGLASVPGAGAIGEGQAEIGVNNQFDPTRLAPVKTQPRNYLFNLGLYDGVELGGRYAVSPALPADTARGDPGMRDLSLNLKWRLPHGVRGLPEVAVGVNDVAGGVKLYDSRYVVATQDFGPLSATLGRGSGSRLNGWFGGAEVWLPAGFSAIAQYDARSAGGALRWVGPTMAALGGAQVVGLASYTGAQSSAGAGAQSSLQLGLQFPLGRGDKPVQRRAAAPANWSMAEIQASEAKLTAALQAKFGPALGPVEKNTGQPSAGAAPAAASAPTAPARASVAAPVVQALVVPVPATTSTTAHGDLRPLRHALRRAGFQGVQVGLGHGGQTLEFRLATAQLKRHRADTVGVLWALAQRWAPADLQTYAASFKVQGQASQRVVVQAAAWRGFIQAATPADAALPKMEVRIGEGAPADTDWVLDADADAEGTEPVLQLFASPYLRSFIGTEVGGPFNVALGLKLQPVVPLWQGGFATADLNLPLANSNSLDAKQPLSTLRPKGGLQVAMLRQLWMPHPSWLTDTAVGIVEHGWAGLAHESMFWPVPGNNLALRLRAGAFSGDDGSTLRQRRYGVATAQQYLPWADITVEAGYGQFWQGDRGATLDLTRWFGETSVSLTFQQTGVRMVGLKIGIPLSRGESARVGRVDIRAADRFDYGIRMTAEKSGLMRPDAALLPATGMGMQQLWLGYGRVQQPAWDASPWRMRNAGLAALAEADASPKP